MTSKLLGINDDADTCGVCGKSGLKRVMWIEREDGEIIQMGTTCGARELGMNKTYSSVEQVAEAYKAREDSRKRKERCLLAAQKEANKMGEDIAVMKNGTQYYTVREKALSTNFYMYRGSVIQWVSPQ